MRCRPFRPGTCRWIKEHTKKHKAHTKRREEEKSRRYQTENTDTNVHRRHDKGHTEKEREAQSKTKRGGGGKRRTHRNVHILYEKGHTEKEGKAQSTNRRERKEKNHEGGQRRTHKRLYIYIYFNRQTKRRGVQKTIAIHVDKLAVRPAVYKKWALYTAGAPPLKSDLQGKKWQILIMLKQRSFPPLQKNVTITSTNP